MKITVNGKIQEVNDYKNLEEFVTGTLEKYDGVIVELNEKIIPRNQWKEQPLQENDAIQLLQLVGGG